MSNALHSKTRPKLRARLEKIFGRQLIHLSDHGHQDCLDILRSGCNVSVIFDIGANIGQSAIKFCVAFPTARILCFEPVKDTYSYLKRNTASLEKVSCHSIAFGSREETATFYLTEKSLNCSLLRPKITIGTEIIQVQTVDGFADKYDIRAIDVLKIDTEGYDLEVLKGANTMLTKNSVGFIIAEVGFHPEDNRHVLFDAVRSLLSPHGFSLFGIYDQQLEWSGQQRLRYANACFVNEQYLTNKFPPHLTD